MKQATAKLKSAKQSLRLEWIEAGSLTDNPDNWRRHPEGQTRALKAMLDDVGWAGALLFNETTGRLIDGHARKDAVDPRTSVPVLVGQWTEDQERKILATLDPIGAMAECDSEALDGLLAEVDLNASGLEDLAAMLDGLAEHGDGVPADETDSPAPASARKRGERTALFLIGHLKFELARSDFDRWLGGIETRVGNDPDKVVREIKRRLKI